VCALMANAMLGLVAASALNGTLDNFSEQHPFEFDANKSREHLSSASITGSEITLSQRLLATRQLCPAESYLLTDFGVCCCGNECCWDYCQWGTPPESCLKAAPNAYWDGSAGNWWAVFPALPPSTWTIPIQGAGCPAPSYPWEGSTCCCGNNCCWDNCRWSNPPESCLVGQAQGAVWTWDESGQNYRAVLQSYEDRCGAPKLVGQWTYMASFQKDAGQTLSIVTGYETSKEITDATEWSNELAVSVSAGYEAFGVSASVEVTSTFSSGASHSVSQASTHTLETGVSFTPEQSGVLWQWQFHAKDECNEADITIADYALTGGSDEPPCCPPGLFADLDQPHGACRDSSVCLCEEETCSGGRRLLIV